MDFLPFAVPDIRDGEIERIVATLKSGWITTGPMVREFEHAFRQCVGAQQSVAVNSCTAAMHLALEAIGLQAGDEVITTPYTFAATAEVIRYFDARPVLVDVDPLTLNIDPNLIEQAVTSRTRAIIPVHIAGLPVELDDIYGFARRYGLRVIEDAAHAFPSKYKGRWVGEGGDIVCYSFYATKTITTGEGGMLCTDDQDVAERCRVMALHGISKDAWKRYTAEGSWYYEIMAPGYKYNMTDLAAAIGLAQLERADEMLQRRRQIAEAYNAVFEEFEELQIPADRADCQHAWHLYMLRLHLGRLEVDRGQVIEALKDRGVGASVHFIPLHIHPYYRDKYGYDAHDYPVAHREYLREISLPIYSKMTDADVQRVIDAVREIVVTNRKRVAT